MRTFLLALSLCAALSGCSHSTDPTPAPPAQPTQAPVTYTDEAGKTAAVATYSAYSVTATPSTGQQARRAVVVRAVLPNGSTLDLTYTFVGTTFIAGAGNVTLDEAVKVDNSGGALTTPTRYQAAGITTGTLVSEATQPASVSGTYAGPLVAGGAVVKLAFSRLTF